MAGLPTLSRVRARLLVRRRALLAEVVPRAQAAPGPETTWLSVRKGTVTPLEQR